MSFTDNYKKALQEIESSGQSTKTKKKRKYTSFNIDPSEVITTTRSSKNDTGDDIAPVASTTKKKKEQETGADIAPVSTVGTVGAVGSDGFYHVALPEDFDASENNSEQPESKIGLTYVQAPEKDERKWFQKGAFEDGYQFGDITKTILGTGEGVGVNLTTGIVGMGEKIVDGLAWLGAAMNNQTMMQAAQDEMVFNYVTGKETDGVLENYQAYQDEVEQGTAEFIQKDLYDEEAVAKKIISVAPRHLLNQAIGVDAERDSVLGEKSDAVVQSAGQLLAQSGLQIVGVPWWLTSGATAFGGQVETALNEGASFEAAGASAAISAGAEVLTEKLSGGIKFGGNTWDDVLLKPLTERIASKGWKFLVNLGIDAAGEGIEEIASSFFSNLGTALYKEENLSEILFSEEATDEYIESFIGGAFLGGVGGSVQGLKPDVAQDVITREYNDRVDEVESTNGRKTTIKEKSAIYNEVVEDVESGYISVDRIEEILGGETYDTYKSTLESETATQEEYDKLYNMKNGDKSDADIARQAELRKILDEGTKSTELKSQLGTEVFELVKNTRLSESYNEQTRKSQAYEADLTQYDEAQQKVIQNAIDSGILNNTNRTHRFVDMIAKISADKGVSFDFTNNTKLKESGFAVDGKQVNGFVTKDGITLNINSSKALNSVVGHEISHVLEGTELYTELQSVLFEYAKSKNDFKRRYDAIMKLYEGVKDANVDAELTADLVGDYLFSDKNFINRLSTQNRNVFQKIYDEIKYLCRVATAGSKEARELEKVKRAFEDAYRESGKAKNDAKGETKYSISETTDGRFAAVVDSDILSNIDTSTWDNSKKTEAKKAAVDALKQFDDGIVVDGITRKVNRTSRREYTRSKYTESLYNHSPDIFADKMRAADVVDDIVVAVTNWTRDGGLKHPRTDNFVDFDHGETLIVSGDAKYSAEVVVGITDAGDAVFYDVVDMKPTAFDIKKEESPTTATTQNAIGDIQGDSFGNNVAQDGTDVKYSLSDSNGRSLTNEQSEYFKDSKARDDNGSLQVVYHGTRNANFTVFKRNMNFFTDSKEMADSYSPNGDMYEGYVNITKPYEIDAEGEKWSRIPIDEATKDFLQEYGASVFEEDGRWRTTPADIAAAIEEAVDNGDMDYDGIIIRNVDDTGSYYKDEDSHLATDYITFNSNQFKNADNQSPTSDPDIRFSLSEAVEETNDLIALHNLQASELVKTLELGGLPMPSVAIIKATDSHEQYGDVSLILPKETIDPQSNRDNMVYGGDAWTPTHPKVEYNVADTYKIKTLFENMLGADIYHALRGSSHLDSDNLAKEIGNSNGSIFDAVKQLGVVKYGYLQSIGQRPETGTKQKTLDGFGRYTNDQLMAVFDAVDGDAIRNANYDSTETLQQIADALNEQFVEQLPSSKKESVFKAFAKKPLYTADNINIYTIQDAYRAWEDAGKTIPTETDYRSLESDLRNNQILEEDADYQRWVESIFDGIITDSGIYNGKDYYTPSGNRRSWNALHWENTLENVVRVMKSQTQTGADAFAPSSALFAVAQKNYRSIAEIKADSDRLGRVSEEEYKALEEEYGNRFVQIANSIKDPNERNSFIVTDDAAELIVDAVRTQRTKAGMLSYLKKWNNQVTEQTVDDIVSLVSDIANMPTGYFEAKPMRAVGFDEIGVYVIPYNTNVKLKQELLNRGYAIAEYNPDIEGDRQKVVNSFEEYKFSLSEVGEQPKRYGRFYVPASELAYVPTQDTAPIVEAPVAETGDVMTPVEDMFPGDAAPVYDEEYERERFASIDDADMPPEMEAPFNQRDTITVDDPFENRDIDDVGNRKVKAYMYENPKVKPFFQAEAKRMLTDLQQSTKGERWVSYGDFSGYGAESYYRFGGTERNTTEDIAYLLDNYGYTYAEIEKGLNAIIEDNGAENNACSKRIEFMLNDRLKDGYTGLWGEEVPPDQDYVDLLNEKQINEYSKEAFDSFMETAGDYAPISEEIAEDVAPEVTYAAEDVAPVQNKIAPVEKYEAIRPKPTKEPRLARATPEEQASAEILTEEPKVDKKKHSAWKWTQEHVFDSGMVFENLSLKTKNRELQAKWNSIRYAEGKAQKLIGEGDASTESLKSIQERVEKSGKTKPFYEYLYHMHNADRMTLAERYEDVENKPVFGDSVTAEISREAAAKLLQENPEFKEWSEAVYTYNKHLREMLVEGGVISDETAELWETMYPHYVPIRRVGDTGLNINVPLDTGRTGINAPIKRATGGNSDILPLFDTMGQRTIQTFKAIAKNRFGVELKNTLGTTIENEAVDVDEAIDSIDTQDSLLQEGKNGMSPTFTVFENGEKVTFEITDEMYEAMKPTNDLFKGTSKVLNKISNIRRGTLTEYNPWFLLKNAVKDVQDVLINSQHPTRTYAAIPSAIKQMATKGHWYLEYLDNGGDQNTYFDNETNTFQKENRALEIAKKVTGLDAISKANNIIERLPRLAEYIASRKEGRSIDVAMLDAARVTTNFAAGGDATKWLNRNGATFLNASVQGVVQQARNIREAKMNGLKGWASLAAKYTLAGLPAILLNNLIWDDDEEYEELSDYVKDNYYIVGKFGDGKFVRIPKGRTVAVIQDAFEQISNAITGDDEVDLRNFLDLVITNLAPNNPIDNNIFSPIVQVAKNETWYGEDLVPTRLQDLPAAEQYDESTDAISRWLGEATEGWHIGDISLEISPYKANYLLDQYSGVIGDTFLPMLTPEAESGNNTFAGNMIAPLKDMFTTDSVMNNQNVSDFYDLSDELTTNAKASDATDEDILKSKYINAVNSDVSDLYKQKREIQNSNLPDAQKYAQVREVQRQIDNRVEDALSNYENINRDGDYAEIGGVYFQWYTPEEGDPYWRKLSESQVTKYKLTKDAGDAHYVTDGNVHYRLDEDGEWTKISDRQLERQEEVTNALNITPEEYWSKTDISFLPLSDGEYEYAYEHPGTYAVAKAVGGYDSYKTYSSALSDIHADKDADGKSISGSRKEKVLDYINGIDADYGEKIILFKYEYPADDTYNYDIIDYLNSRDDISYEEMKTILIELGFTVHDDGTITW